MLKKLIAVGLVGFGTMATGCSVETSDESFSSSQEELVGACLDTQGTKATQAALAVAMADELGRWDPLTDLQTVKEGYFFFTRLKSTAVCLKNNCALTKAILGQQNFTVDQNNFNADNFRSAVEQGFGRATNVLTNLKKNNPTKVPPAHKLTKLSGPSGTASCGSQYLFQADQPNGTALTTAQASNLVASLCYYGQDSSAGSCGSNQLVGFSVTTTGCPAGRVCVSVATDPNDNGTGVNTTPGGSGPIYTLNRIYNPSNSLLNSTCTTTTNKAGKLQSKCTAKPTTCGYLYCTTP
jgi:hypothetical protein